MVCLIMCPPKGDRVIVFISYFISGKITMKLKKHILDCVDENNKLVIS